MKKSFDTTRWPWASSTAPDPELPLDRFNVSRLLLAVLSPHEQRHLLVRLIRADQEFREEIVPFLAPLVGENVGQDLSRLEAALAAGVDAEMARVSILEKEPEFDLDLLIHGFTFEDLFQLGDVTRQLFSWRAAEHLLRDANSGLLDLPTRRTRLFMASMVVEGLEILIAAGVLAPYPRVLEDLRRRLRGIGNVLELSRQSKIRNFSKGASNGPKSRKGVAADGG